MIKRLKLFYDEKNNVYYELVEHTDMVKPYCIYKKNMKDRQPIWYAITDYYFYKKACLNKLDLTDLIEK